MNESDEIYLRNTYDGGEEYDCLSEVITLRAELRKTKDALAEAHSCRDGMTEREKLVRDGFCFDSARDCEAAKYLIGVIDVIRWDRSLLSKRMVELEQQLAQLEKVIAGMRENAAAIAVRLGVDCEGMDDAATWHASAEAIEKLGKVTKKLATEILEWRKALWLNHGHTGLYGDDGEMQCNIGGCMLDFKRDSLEKILSVWEWNARLEYAVHKKDTQPPLSEGDTNVV